MLNLFGIFNSSKGSNDIKMENAISLYIHDELHTVKAQNFSPTTTLNEYLRKSSFLTGTKVMCREGGCGCCVVAAVIKHPITNQEEIFAVNSCLVSIFSCHGWRIITVEGVGSSKTNYHKIQTTLVKFNGTQCGFCTSGMIMTMYQLSQKTNLKMGDVENSFGGNICRCTGYRPILAAFKSLCIDVDPKLIGTIPDIEELPSCAMKEKSPNWTHLHSINEASFGLEFKESKWYKVFTISDILNIFQQFPTYSYKLISGNTATGVYEDKSSVNLYIDIRHVKEILAFEINGSELVLGANITLTETMDIFRKLSKTNKEFSYLDKMADHIDLIASVPVRNIGSLAGNLSIKHSHNDFPSDIFLILETIGAMLTIVDISQTETKLDLLTYLKTDMVKKVIKNIHMPSLNASDIYGSYKIMPRAQNAHAVVNAGFLLKLNNDSSIATARIVYGGINPTFIRAEKLEQHLIGANPFNNTTLQECFKILNDEIVPNFVLPEPSPEFRKKLAIALFYKFVLSVAPKEKITPKNVSGGQILTRPISNGTQDFSTNESLYPVTKPIPKIESLAQVSGEAEYIMDMPDRPGQLFGALVLAKATPHSIITKIDTSRALAVEGVVGFFDKNSIPGKNSFVPFSPVDEEIFCSGTVVYYSQPVGIIVATSQEIAESAAELVEILYIPGQRKPLFTIRDILKANATQKIINERNIEPKSKGTDVKHIVKGSFNIGMQYHFHMETQCCNAIPIEDGIDVFPSTQHMEMVQTGIAESLQISANKVNVKVRRLGGGYGGKISRNGMISCQAALAAHLLKKPVKLWLPFEVNMKIIGKRCPLLANYEIDVDDNGKIQYLTISLYSDYGMGGNEPMISELIEMFLNCYNHDTYKISAYSTRSDTHANTWCRAPATTEGIGLIESIMDHIAYVVDKDPLLVRINNFNEKYTKLTQFINNLVENARISERKKNIEEFNKNNRWIKRGISIVPMAYQFHLFGNWNVFISIYQSDGTVAIAHGGIEMGQGINTKAVQVCAYAFGIPLEMVCIKPSNNLVSPNIQNTGGSITSEAVCFGILKAANILKDRMEEVKKKLPNPTWLNVVRKCYEEGIPLSSMYSFNPKEANEYIIYGVCSTEVEVDILTGNNQILRVDLLEDTGDSLSPEIDIGQVEGAFIMGQGFWTTEKIIQSEEGEILTNRTWNYKIPGAKDIPIDFRVQFPRNNPNPLGILNSKATGEPPHCMSCSVPLAIRNAIKFARIDSDSKADKWYPFDGPSNIENIFLNSLHDYTQYVL